MTHIVDSDNKRVAIRISTALLRDDAGGIVGGVETFQDLTQLEQLRKQLERRYSYEDIIGRSPSMRSLFRILPQVGQSNSTVLIEGDSGTGKELFARAIHNLSQRNKGPFVPSTARPCLIRCWNPNCSATRPALSPGPTGTNPADSPWPGAAPYFSMK